jgi:CheY-like chemotaxis protein/DNA-binding XRE family transcriptional regulator
MTALPVKVEGEEVDPIDVFVGQQLKKFRKKVGWTLQELSEKVNISHQQIHKYEHGYTRIPTSILFKLCLLFGVSPNCFFEGINLELQESGNDNLISRVPRTKINILVVEDSSADEFLIRKILDESEYDHELYCLHDGEEFLAYLRSDVTVGPFTRPDIILMDLNLPKVDGNTLLRAVKHNPKWLDIPVIVMTNSLNKADVIMAYKNYASGYINKAFDYDIFKRKIQAVLNYWMEAIVT